MGMRIAWSMALTVGVVDGSGQLRFMDITKRFEGTGRQYFCRFRHLDRLKGLSDAQILQSRVFRDGDDDRQNRHLAHACG